MFPQELFPGMKSGGSIAANNPQESAADRQRVEVTLEQQDGGECVALRYLTWTDGLGWCCQKTIRVGAEQLDELHHAITAARLRHRRQRADAGEPAAPAQVIQFPSVS